MEQVGNYLIPFLLCGTVTYGLYTGVPVFEAFLKGARRGIGTAVQILPSLIALATAVGMLRVSGALDVLSYALSVSYTHLHANTLGHMP